MDGVDPPPSKNVHADRLVEVRRQLQELDHRELLALSATSNGPRPFPWASLGPEAGLTEAEEDFVDYWSPELVVDECRMRRALICALDEWALTADEADQRFVDSLLQLMSQRTA